MSRWLIGSITSLTPAGRACSAGPGEVGGIDAGGGGHRRHFGRDEAGHAVHQPAVQGRGVVERLLHAVAERRLPARAGQAMPRSPACPVARRHVEQRLRQPGGVQPPAELGRRIIRKGTGIRRPRNPRAERRRTGRGNRDLVEHHRQIGGEARHGRSPIGGRTLPPLRRLDQPHAYPRNLPRQPAVYRPARTNGRRTRADGACCSGGIAIGCAVVHPAPVSCLGHPVGGHPGVLQLAAVRVAAFAPACAGSDGSRAGLRDGVADRGRWSCCRWRWRCPAGPTTSTTCTALVAGQRCATGCPAVAGLAVRHVPLLGPDPECNLWNSWAADITAMVDVLPARGSA